MQRAINAAGGPTAVAARFSLSRVSVHEWVQNGRIPPDKAPIVADIAAGAGVYVPLEELCAPVPWAVAQAHMAGNKAEAIPGGGKAEAAAAGA